MSNTIKTMRDAISAANAAMLDVKKAIDRNNERYSRFIADQENKRLYDRAVTITADAKRAIETTYTTALDGLKSWDRLDGAAIDDSDLRLLKSGLKLARDDVQRLAIKHQNNPTMTALLKNYADENCTGVFFPDAQETANYLDQLRASAIGKINRIGREFGIDSFYCEQWAADLTSDADRALNGLTPENTAIE